MIKGLVRAGWAEQVCAYLISAIAFALLHVLSQTMFELNVGVEVIGLLFLPYRFWPALMVGAALPNLVTAWACLSTLGEEWSLIRAFPTTLLMMPVVWLARSRLRIFPDKNTINIRALLECVLIISIVLTGYSTVLASFAPDIDIGKTPLVVPAFFLGNYVGLLTFLPFALVVRMDWQKGALSTLVKQLAASSVLTDGLCVVVPVMALLGFMSERLDSQLGAVFEYVMFVPAIWLTVRHGWRAVVFGGTLMLIVFAVMHPAPDYPSANTLIVEAVICAGVTVLYAFGAYVSVSKDREVLERDIAAEQQAMVRRNLAASERKLKLVAQQMEFEAGNLSIVNARMLEQLRRYVPNLESHAFYKQATKAHERIYALAESLHPVAWRERGLPAALTETLARALDEAGMSYRCEISGRGFMSMEPDVLSALYRSACDAICHVADDLTCSGIQLKIRGGQTNGRRWIAFRVEAVLDDNEVAKAVFHAEGRRDLRFKLGSSTSDVEQMRGHAKAFDGIVHVRSKSGRYVISGLLHGGAIAEAAGATAAPRRLWVH